MFYIRLVGIGSLAVFAACFGIVSVAGVPAGDLALFRVAVDGMVPAAAGTASIVLVALWGLVEMAARGMYS